ncbi:MAG: phosphoribosylglycinamide formyltransferase [Salibacteraceae bacterium]|nr:phosphoribosylglycinamide formyltransferase [Salibacteraceae bacterium]|tara:strand:+ start:9612 stop:10196 length:585 start_codon:yes stop_codon:yes gene_type:complete
MKRIAVFASGGGSNAQKILQYFRGHKTIEVGLVLSNKVNAGVFEHAKNFQVHSILLSKSQIINPTEILELLDENNIDVIVLAGYLKKIPLELIQTYPDRILNIHPSLLPKYGGKGMYGITVHKAVKLNKDLISGPTIHLVSEEYDKGRILFQKKIPITISHTTEQIAAEVLKVEHEEYANVIEGYINQYYERLD